METCTSFGNLKKALNIANLLVVSVSPSSHATFVQIWKASLRIISDGSSYTMLYCLFHHLRFFFRRKLHVRPHYVTLNKGKKIANLVFTIPSAQLMAIAVFTTAP